jgi:3-oxoacyl-[acyl-carrier-protein] synthase II
MSTRRVVVTGIGMVTPVGIGTQLAWENLLAGKSGAARISCFDPDEQKTDVKIACEVADFELENFYPDKRKVGGMLKEMDRVSQLAIVASKLALEDANLDVRENNPERTITFIGTGIGGLKTTVQDAHKLKEGGPRKIGLRSIIRMMPNAPSGQVAIEFGAKGRAKSDATACASGLDSLLDAYIYIKAGRADVAISGASEACVDTFSVASFSNMTALSKRPGDPTKVSRPFNKTRDGFVIGEGCAILILEELEHALKRNAKIYAEIVGGGASCDASHIVAPHETGEGAARAITEALADANLKPEDINYINAHGTSTPLNDERETLAIKSVFKEHAYKLAISSTKSMIGHSLGAAGAIGAAVLALSLRDQKVHPTINLDEPDPVCDLDYVPNQARAMEINSGLAEALGFGGHNTVLVMSKYKD